MLGKENQSFRTRFYASKRCRTLSDRGEHFSNGDQVWGNVEYGRWRGNIPKLKTLRLHGSLVQWLMSPEELKNFQHLSFSPLLPELETLDVTDCASR